MGIIKALYQEYEEHFKILGLGLCLIEHVDCERMENTKNLPHLHVFVISIKCVVFFMLKSHMQRWQDEARNEVN